MDQWEIQATGSNCSLDPERQIGDRKGSAERAMRPCANKPLKRGFALRSDKVVRPREIKRFTEA